jgi:hypothetical protein
MKYELRSSPGIFIRSGYSNIPVNLRRFKVTLTDDQKFTMDIDLKGDSHQCKRWNFWNIAYVDIWNLAANMSINFGQEDLAWYFWERLDRTNRSYFIAHIQDQTWLPIVIPSIHPDLVFWVLKSKFWRVSFQTALSRKVILDEELITNNILCAINPYQYSRIFFKSVIRSSVVLFSEMNYFFPNVSWLYHHLKCKVEHRSTASICQRMVYIGNCCIHCAIHNSCIAFLKTDLAIKV